MNIDYDTALQMIKKAVGHLERDDGNMDTATLLTHVTVLNVATKVVAERNGIIAP